MGGPVRIPSLYRSTRSQGVILARGSGLAATIVEARVQETSIEGPLPGRWQRLALDQVNQQFSVQLPVVAGRFYRVEIKSTNTLGKPQSFTIQHVGVGEVFVIAGQSNSTNYGEIPHTTQTGMVTTFSGTEWSLANDPNPAYRTTAAKAASSRPSATPSIADTTSPSASPRSVTVPPAASYGQKKSRNTSTPVCANRSPPAREPCLVRVIHGY